MNKLTALYSVMKNVQEMKSGKSNKNFNGKMNSQLKFGEVVIASAFGETLCTEEACTKKAELHYGVETMKFERSGKSGGDCCGGSGYGHRHGHAHIHKHMSMHRAEGRDKCYGPSMRKGNKLGHAMFMIKLLDKMEYVEQADGQRWLSLEMTMADLPENLRGQMEAHMQFKREHIKSMMVCCSDDCCNDDCCGDDCCNDTCCCEACGCNESSSCSAMTWIKKSGLTDIDPDSLMPEKFSVKVQLDENGKPLQLDMQASVAVKTTAGEDKPLHFSFEAKVL